MRPANYVPDASALLTALASLTVFAAPALAQNNNNPPPSNNNDGDNDNNNSQPSEAPAETTGNRDNEASSTQANEPERTTEPKPSSTEENKEDEEKTSESSKTSEKATITAPAEKATETSIDAPKITATGSQVSEDLELSGFPSLTKQIGIPTYPPPAVPPVGDAPFMQHSTLPDGTVFIAVGAILGAFGVAILLWRFIVSCMLHRSVQRATMEQHSANSKASFPAPPAPFYKYTDQGSTMSLSGAAAGRTVRRTNRGPIPSSNPSQSNLFFSPTAAQNNAGGGNRGSAFLPSGFYAANSGSPAPNHGHSISLTNLRPDSRGHYANASRNTLNPSPPGSPHFPTARRDMSASSLNLNTPPGNERAPSAYLEDLLADDPGSLPPPHMPGSGSSRHSAHLANRTGSPGYRA